jgi:hypothetical protein
MHTTITSEIVVAYSQCPRKAFLLLCTDEQELPHKYIRILEQQKRLNQTNYIDMLIAGKQTFPEETSYSVNALTNNDNLVNQATLKAAGLEASCDVLTLERNSSSSGGCCYEPTIIAGTYSISKEEELELAFTGFVLGQMQKKLPLVGHIVRMGGQIDRVKLEPSLIPTFMTPRAT